MKSSSNEPDSQEIKSRQFYLTPTHPCSYLPGRKAQTLFLDPRVTIYPALYQALTEHGFRRSGGHLYRPHCRDCKACIPTRILVDEFSPRRNQRRIAARNADLTIRVEPAVFNRRFYDLYTRYVRERHADGEMYPPSTDQFRSFLLSQWSNSLFLCSYLGDELLAVAVTDQQPAGVSALYTFFEPAEHERSLGTWSILKQVEFCREAGLPHLYLGYWIRESRKMRYKTSFRPVEIFRDEEWRPLD